jgi:hypothetical protein
LPRKTEKLTIRIDPVVKDVLREAAEKEHRSVANLLEVLIRKHASRLGIQICKPENELKKVKRIAMSQPTSKREGKHTR